MHTRSVLILRSGEERERIDRLSLSGSANDDDDFDTNQKSRRDVSTSNGER